MSLPSPKIDTLVDLLRWRAQQQPHKVAYTFLADGDHEEVNITYAELDRQAQALAVRLQRMVQPGERAILLYPPGLAFITGFFGCLYAGVIAVPAYPPHSKRPMPRLDAIVRNAQPKVALTTQAVWPKVNAQFTERTELTEEFILPTDTLAVEQLELWRPPTLATDSLAFLQYTSGSTGNAKGVMITHGNVFHNEQMIATAFENNEESIGVGWLPLFHDMGLIGHVLQPLYLGIPVILMSPLAFLQRPIRWLRTISHYRATGSSAPNFGYDLCIQAIKPEQCTDLDLSSWRVAVTGAEPVRAETVQRFCERFGPYGFRPEAFYPCYGLAESTVFVSGGLSTDPPILLKVDKAALEKGQVLPVVDDQPGGQTLVGCGQSWADQQIMIVHPDQLTPCAEGEVGEIWVRGPSVALGYWQQPEATQETFGGYLADTGTGPFLRTGDLGFLQGKELFVTGRIKDLIIIRGRNHYPQDIEQTVEKSHPALQHSAGATFSVEIDGEERLVIVQEVKRTHIRNLPLAEVLGNIRQAVTQEHQVQIHSLLLLEPGTIPKTSSGKIQRRACREEFLANTLAAINTERPKIATTVTVKEQPMPVAAVTNGHPEKKPARTVHRVELQHEAVLDPLIRFKQTANGSGHSLGPVKAIFLTGATGFLGVHLLYELLQKTQADIYCLVRSADRDAGMERIQRKLIANGLGDKAYRARIIPVVGDLAQPLLGLTQQDFDHLAEVIDVIYHNGAVVSFVQPYRALKGPNVDGTQQIIRLATQSKTKPLHYVSTVFVFGARKHFDGRIIGEDEALDEHDEPLLGYFQSKWVAEKLVTLAREQGLPVFIYRPGVIIGASQTGIWDNPDDFICRLIKGCIQLGTWPTVKAEWYLTPVDYVSKAIVHLAQQIAPERKVFHLVNPHALQLSELFDGIQAFGYPVQPAPLPVWQAKLLALGMKPQENALGGLTPLLAKRRASAEQVSLPELFDHGQAPKFDCTNTLKAFTDPTLVCPPIDRQQLSTYLAYFIQSGFLAAPTQQPALAVLEN